MYRVETDRAFELAADFELNLEAREKVREIIVRNLKNVKDPYIIIESEQDADLFRKKWVSQSEYYSKMSKLHLKGDREERRLAIEMLNIVTKNTQSEKQGGDYIKRIPLSDLPEEIKALFENQYVTEIKVQ